MKKKVISSVVFAIILSLAFSVTTVSASAATTSTAKYNSRPANMYIITYANYSKKDGHTYEHWATIKTKGTKNQKIKIVETKGGRLGCYNWDNKKNKPYLMHYRDKTTSRYSGKIQYWLYEGTSPKGKVIASDTSVMDHSEYIKLPKANRTYTIKLKFFITQGRHSSDNLNANLRYVSEKYPKWYIQYDTKYFNKPSVKSVIIE